MNFAITLNYIDTVKLFIIILLRIKITDEPTI